MRPATRPITRIRETPGDPAVAFRRVLVALDGTAESEEILSHLRRFDPAVEEILLLHVLPRTPGADPVFRDPKDAVRYLMRLQSNAPWVRARLRVEHGETAERILAVQREEGADLVALASQPKGAVTRLLFGSTTRDVLRATPTPVLLARQGLARTPVRLKRILVAVGGDPADPALLESVRRLALRLLAEVALVRLRPAGANPDAPVAGLLEFAQGLKGFRSVDLDDRRDPGAAFLELAAELKPDLVAVSMRAGKDDGALPGGLAEAVLRQGSAPVLVRAFA